MSHDNQVTSRRYVVARGAQIDTRRNERIPRAERSAYPTLVHSDVLKDGDPIDARDIEGGEVALARLVELGMVIAVDGNKGAPRFPLSVAPGKSTTTSRGVIGPGEQIYETELDPASLESLIERGVVLRMQPVAVLRSAPGARAADEPAYTLRVGSGYVIGSARRSGIVAGTEVDADEFTKADLERFIGCGMIVRSAPRKKQRSEPQPPEAA